MKLFKQSQKIVTVLYAPPEYIQKGIRIMKVTAILLLAFCMHVSATVFAQKISINEKNAKLEDVFDKIRQQTGYNIIYGSEILEKSKPVTLKLKEASIDDALKASLLDQELVYEIDNRTILIKEKTPSFIDKLRETVKAAFTNIDVTGRVVDSVGNALAGATVTVKGTKQAVTTGADGSFLLKNVAEGAILVITYTGYKPKEIKTSKDVGSIKMEVAVGDLGEVVITINTGYQKIKPEQSTGAVSQLSTKQYESRISTNFMDGLVNKLPGLMINNDVSLTTTVPGGSSSSRPLFNIRGISTMSANQSPLIVLDGYPTTLTLDMIDPNEIESVTILKDAAAATVYGVRASNGVIVIERKQGVAGKAQINFRTTVDVTPKEDYSRYRWDKNASQVVTNYQRASLGTTVNSSSWGLSATAAAGAKSNSQVYYIAAQAAAGAITPAQAESAYAALASYDNINDYSRLFERTHIKQTYTLNVSGGNENALYYISGNFRGNRSDQVLNDDNQLSLSARTNLKLSKKLSLELTTDYNEQRNNSAPVPGPDSYSPYERFQDANGMPAPIIGSSIAPLYNTFIMSKGLQDDAFYPLIDMNEVSTKTHTVNNKITADFRYDLGKGFNLGFGGIYETSVLESRYLASELSSVVKQYINDYTALQTDGTLKFNIPKGAYLNQQNEVTSGYTARAQLNYNKKFGVHSINAIMGTEVRSLIDRGNQTTSFGYNDQTLLQQPVDYASIVSNAVATRGTYGLGTSLSGNNSLFNQTYSEDRFLSAYTNLVYAYKNRYSATGSVRIDQSNLFGTNPKYKYKPLWAVGAAWNIHNENFMHNIGWINQLKLRGSYGFNGNVAKLSLPEVIAQPVLNTQLVSPSIPSLALASYANSSLRWEQTLNINTGLDFIIFKNIHGSVDYYTKKSTDLLGNTLIDPTLGVSPTLVNQATIKNNGIEFNLNADWIARRKFNWNTGLVLAHNTSEVLDVYRKGNYNPQTLGALGYVKGYPVGALFAYNTVGLDNTGFPIIKDPNGNILQTNNNTATSPQTIAMNSPTSGLVLYQGSSIPTINAGLSNRIDVGNFYFYAMINYYGGFKVRVPRATPNTNRPLVGAGNYWKVPGDELNTDIPALAANGSANSSLAYNYAASYVVPGDYITLGDLVVSYSLENLKFLKNAGFKTFELKAQAHNLYTKGFNSYNYSQAAGSGNFAKGYITPTYSLALFTNF